MTRWRLLSGLAPLLAAAALQAQNPRRVPAPGDSPPYGPDRPGMMGPQQREMMLRRQIEMRLGEVIRNQLGLNDQQMTRLQAAMRANQERRRDIMMREMAVRRAMAEQMQPGIAANSDSLNRLLRTSSRLRIERAQSDDQFMTDLEFLTPVQRTRFMFIMQRFEERMQQIRQGRGWPDGPEGPDGRLGPDGPDGPTGRPSPDGPGGQRGRSRPDEGTEVRVMGDG